MHYFTQIKAYHDAFTCPGIKVDVVNWFSDLPDYDIVIVPTLFITNDRIETNIKEYNPLWENKRKVVFSYKRNA